MAHSRSRFSVAVALCAVGVSASACNGKVTVLAPDPGAPSGLLEDPESTQQQQSGRVDLLFAIDNSKSMDDASSMRSKQVNLARSAARLVERLVHPLCRDASGASTGASVEDALGAATCPAGGTLEFQPVRDLHVGVLSSSLGNFGNTGELAVCTGDIVSDHAQLVSRGIGDRPIEPNGFLAYGPGSGQNAYTNATELSESLSALVQNTGSGCGIEAQLESLYQFLTAPDPWATIDVVDGVGAATYAGSNDTVLVQRRAFLRPDSLVSIVMLTDEDDASIDPLSIGGAGRLYAARSFPNGNQRNFDATFTAARGTSACEAEPTSASCTSCAYAFNSPPTPEVAADPNCRTQESAYYGADDDDINARFFDMKRRYGVEPRYPISRYARALSRFVLPGRAEEHDEEGTYLPDAGTCRNPLFASALPAGGSEELCNLPAGPRNRSLVYFSVLGGAPNELLGPDQRDADGRLGEDSWEKLLGRDFASYDRTGIDPRMLQSITPRPGRPGPGAPDAEPSDPGNLTHRDWYTNKRDLQFACTYLLPDELIGTAADNRTCDAGSDSPLCEPGGPGLDRRQIRSQAHPTPRPFAVAKALGRQATVASICPADPTVGYGPALDALVDRMAAGLIK